MDDHQGRDNPQPEQGSANGRRPDSPQGRDAGHSGFESPEVPLQPHPSSSWVPEAAKRPASPLAASEPHQGWGEIDDFEKHDLPPFPVEALPRQIGDWTAQESRATQTPSDLPGLLALSVCSAALAKHVEVRVRDEWVEPCNLFTVVLLGPGNRKSQVFSDALRPLRTRERELIEQAAPLVEEAGSERRQQQARLKHLEKIAAENANADKRESARAEACQLAARLSTTSELYSPRLLVDNVTEEKLEMMLQEQGGRMASMSAEGGVFDLMQGKYSGNGTPQFDAFLKAHAGDSIVTDRVGRGQVIVEKPALTCAYAIQPEVLNSVRGNSAFRGKGLLARFLYAKPNSWVGYRVVAALPVEQDARDAYEQCVRRLVSFDGEVVLSFDRDAEYLMRSWEAEVEEMLGHGGVMEYTRDWGAKLAGATARIAVILQCVGASEIDESLLVGQNSLERAIKIARYLIPHAEEVLEAPESPYNADARYLLEWVRRKGLRSFTRRDAQQACKRRFPQASLIEPSFQELVDRNYLRPLPPGPKRPGRPSPELEVNPLAFDDGKRAQKPQNQASTPFFEAFENKVNEVKDEDWGIL